MSTTSTVTGTRIDRDLATIPFGVELKVETRKMIDTRGGLWMFLITGGLLVLAMVVALLVGILDDGAQLTGSGFMQVMLLPVSILMPVFAILTVTSEWSQRTNLTSFTIEPSRLRLMVAKFVAVSILALGTLVLALGLGALGNLLYGAMSSKEVVWDLTTKDTIWLVVLQLCFFWMAFALATLLLNTPAAVAVFYVAALMLPFMVYATLYAIFDWAKDIIPWLDFNYAAAPLMNGTDFMGEPVDVGVLQWAQFAFTVLLWIVLPLTVGLRRLRRAEIK